jgi:hypothetical protein
MKTKFVCLFCAGLMVLFTATPTLADQGRAERTAAAPSAEAIFADIVVVRPLTFAATVIGSALFVVALPVAAISRSVEPTAHALVVRPARATFTRPLGDFESMR